MASNSLLDMQEEGVSYGLEGLKLMIYGGNNIGKTPQSMRFPKPLLLMGETGGSALKGYKKHMKTKKASGLGNKASKLSETKVEEDDTDSEMPF